jgi:hypothetical protein
MPSPHIGPRFDLCAGPSCGGQARVAAPREFAEPGPSPSLARCRWLIVIVDVGLAGVLVVEVAVRHM